MRYQLELEPIVPAASGLDCLSPGERRHYSGLRSGKRRREWLAGRIAAKRLVRKMIESSGLLIQENEIPIERTPGGAPFVQMTAHPWSLSISHSGEWAAAAMPEDFQSALIGVDIEKTEARDPAWLEIAFHPSERAETLDPAGQTRLWTRKEAVSKLLGIGLSADLRDFRFPGGSDAPEFHGKAREAWEALGTPAITFDSPAVCPGYILSVAYAAPQKREAGETN